MGQPSYIFSHLFKKYRLREGVSQTQLATLLGVRYEQINRIENQKSYPSGELMDAFLKLSDTSLETALSDLELLITDPLIKDLLESSQSLSVLQKKQVLGMIKVLSQVSSD